MSNYQDPKTAFVVDRRILPIHEPVYRSISEPDLSKAPAPPPVFQVKAPENSPNVIMVLLDDMGFGASSAYGGPCDMPTAERLANKGVQFNRFHTTALCAPTRAALLSGYNHHSLNMGMITELATAYPGNLSTRPKTMTPLARVLKDNGYATAQFGKCHETPVWEASAAGPFDHWPTYSGFEKFYGFIGGETSQYEPELVEGTRPIEIPDYPNYHLSEDLTDKCIEWMDMQTTLAPDKPFFIYFAPGATHAPHHAPESYRDMYKGKFDEGWDVIRTRTFENMKKMGIVPADAKIAAKPSEIADWKDLPENEQALYIRQMEIYAGFARHIDDQVARIVDYVEEKKINDNTVIIYILGDNGASAEGDFHGVVNENSTFNLVEETLNFVESKKDILGTALTNNHYSVGWAIALDSPFTWTKQVASNFGGTRNGIIFHCPEKFSHDGKIRNQFHHCIDIAPTILDMCNIPQPKTVDGVEQMPMEGVSMLPALIKADNPETRNTQYFAIGGYEGIYHEGWFAGIIALPPWDRSYKNLNTKWELYNIEEDFSCANDLADVFPDKLEELKAKFNEEAISHNVYPIDTRGFNLFDAKVAGRPSLIGDRKEMNINRSVGKLTENTFLSLKNTSFEMTADVDVIGSKKDGVIFSHGGRFGGYSLYIKDGKPVYYYNFLNIERFEILSDTVIEANRNAIKVHFEYDGGEPGSGGTATLYVNNKQVGKGRIDRTIPRQISSFDKVKIGKESGTPVSDAFKPSESEFSGRIYNINVKILN